MEEEEEEEEGEVVVAVDGEGGRSLSWEGGECWEGLVEKGARLGERLSVRGPQRSRCRLCDRTSSKNEGIRGLHRAQWSVEAGEEAL